MAGRRRVASGSHYREAHKKCRNEGMASKHPSVSHYLSVQVESMKAQWVCHIDVLI